MTEPKRGPADRWMLALAWILGGVAFLYFGFFMALLLDGPVLKTNVIEDGIRNVSPQLHSSIGEVIQVVYAPLIWLVRKAGLA